MMEKYQYCDHALGSTLDSANTQTMNYVARVQGSIGCLQRGPGPDNQKYLVRGKLAARQQEDEVVRRGSDKYLAARERCVAAAGCTSAYMAKTVRSNYGPDGATNALTSHKMFSGMGGASNVNMGAASCYESRVNMANKDNCGSYDPNGDYNHQLNNARPANCALDGLRDGELVYMSSAAWDGDTGTKVRVVPTHLSARSLRAFAQCTPAS